MTQTTDNFRRQLRNAEGMLRRRDSGQLTGRNDAASQAGLRMHRRQLHEMVLASDEVADMLDNDPRLAARYDRFERRSLGLPA